VDASLLLESDREAAEDVRLGGGRKGANGFVFRLTRLLGGGRGGGGSPLSGFHFVLDIGTLNNYIAPSYIIIASKLERHTWCSDLVHFEASQHQQW